MAPFITKKVLMITNIERGEINAFLATASALTAANVDLDLHLATFAGAQDVLPKGATYHQINGLPMSEALQKYFIRTQGHANFPESFTKEPGFVNTQQAIKEATSTAVPYTGPQMVDVYTSIVSIIKDVEPDLIVVDSLMAAGLTACYESGIKFICLGPTSIKDFAVSSQPRAAALWKFPAPFSGFSYPVQWYHVPLNLYYTFSKARAFKKDNQRKDVQSYLNAHCVIRTQVDLIDNLPQGVKILVSSLPELDFPLKVPAHIIPCGPVVRTYAPLYKTSPKLAEWLANGKTILVNMGALVKISEGQAVEMARALRVVIDRFDQDTEKRRLQVLWKLQKKDKYSVFAPDCALTQVLGREFAFDRVRVIDWIQPEPLSILQTGDVICSVHHGGAGSFNEAIIAGVPQVVLPAWADNYDYAQRVELLGVGRCGNKTTKPRWTSEELSDEMLEVLVGDNAAVIKEKALHLQQVCRKNGSGAENAAIAILRECNLL
ncbi:family 1 glycosyltransferase [Trichoderma longibrachiatum]|uniref:Glycosyltransferase family 1 protein n=1 Tax=Trichoderma longibrachiatum ATCC 18648 TaxID=983965 RepID=A0A2T4CE94_TRILO|nr:glycosyltransferase family 1 protein [Trichoderma longibrachiatum ATCC 18648]